MSLVTSSGIDPSSTQDSNPSPPVEKEQRKANVTNKTTAQPLLETPDPSATSTESEIQKANTTDQGTADAQSKLSAPTESKKTATKNSTSLTQTSTTLPQNSTLSNKSPTNSVPIPLANITANKVLLASSSEVTDKKIHEDGGRVLVSGGFSSTWKL